jgi:hypothetical protein
LQTDEDRAEWARFQSSLTHIRAELGPDVSVEVDAAGDVNMADAANGARKATVRDNNVYLFQIPPLMPELLSASIKKEPVEEQAPLPAPAPTPAPAAIGKKDAKIKLEEGAFTDTAKAHEAICQWPSRQATRTAVWTHDIRLGRYKLRADTRQQSLFFARGRLYARYTRSPACRTGRRW